LLVEARARAKVVLPGAEVKPPVVPQPVRGLAGQASVVRPAVARLAVTKRAGRRAGLEDQVHVVVAGESLWSIANDVLGGRATVAQVARKVNRLWELNRARIGTGDRDLLPVGTRLELK
jgi:nucleoid-associated protein YgaU